MSGNKNCACGGNCGCGKGNYTYIRWASDDQGSNFSTSRTEGGIERCYQGIIVSPNKLDETSASFEALFFQRWINSCKVECCGGCDWSDYLPANTGGSYLNVWEYLTFTTPISNTQDLSVQNRIGLQKFIHLEVVTPPITFLGEDGLPLVSGQTYTLEITLATNTAVSPTDAMEFSFGDGALATKWTVDQSTSPGVYTLLMTAADGTFNASTLVCRTLQPVSNTNESRYVIEDFRIGTADCYDPDSGSGGSDNEGENIGTGGVGPYKGMDGTKLQFKKINAGSNKVSVTDDTANDEIDIDVNESNLQIDKSQITNFSHTHTASEITDFDTEVSNNSDVSANTSKRHDSVTLNSGQVTKDSADLSSQELELKLATTSTSGVMSSADKVKLDGLTGTGEANTASNSGAGVGLFDAKTGSDLEFKSIKSSDSTIDIDDLTGTGEVDIVVNESLLDVANMQDSRKPFQTITAAGPQFTWRYVDYYNAKINIPTGGNYDLIITGAQDGDYGTLIVENSVGDNAVALNIPNGNLKAPPYSKVVADGNATITLTPNAFDIFSWVFDGTTFWWTYGHNYT